MTVHKRRMARAAAIAVGVVALGGTFSGIAFASPSGDSTIAPAAVPSLSVPVKKDDDDKNKAPKGTAPYHYYPGATSPYDNDLYSGTESYDHNYCRDTGQDRTGAMAMLNDLGFNGDDKKDCKYHASQYHPKRTGFKQVPKQGGRNSGYNGYLGTETKRLNKNNYN